MKHTKSLEVVKPARKKSRSLRMLAASKPHKATDMAVHTRNTRVAATGLKRHLSRVSSHRSLVENDFYSDAADCIRQTFKATPYGVCAAESFYW
eukprot:scaffold139053_cov133-Phaeocystis_antarctica.AAC.1